MAVLVHVFPVDRSEPRLSISPPASSATRQQARDRPPRALVVPWLIALPIEGVARFDVINLRWLATPVADDSGGWRLGSGPIAPIARAGDFDIRRCDDAE